MAKVSVLVSKPKHVLTTTLTKLDDNYRALLAVFNRYACCLFTINHSSYTRFKSFSGHFMTIRVCGIPECRSQFYWSTDRGGGGDIWSCKTCKDPVKSSPSTYQLTTFYRPDTLPVTQPTVSPYLLNSTFLGTS